MMRKREILAIEKRKAKKKAKLLKEKEKKKEIERKKKAKEKAKKHKMALERQRKANIKYKRKVYAAKRAERLKELKENGDRMGYFNIIITENGKRIKTISRSRRFLDAYEKYKKSIEENKPNMIGNKTFTVKMVGGKKYAYTTEYEILLIENVGADNTYKTSFREDGGKIIESKITDSDKHVILSKNKWYVPDLYGVFGYHPVNDRKTGKWIFDNIIMKDLGRDNSKIIFLYRDKLIVQDNSGIEIVTAKYYEPIETLFNTLETTTNGNKYLTYIKNVPNGSVQNLIKKIKDKTGWCRNACISGRSIKKFN